MKKHTFLTMAAAVGLTMTAHAEYTTTWLALYHGSFFGDDTLKYAFSLGSAGNRDDRGSR